MGYFIPAGKQLPDEQANYSLRKNDDCRRVGEAIKDKSIYTLRPIATGCSRRDRIQKLDDQEDNIYTLHTHCRACNYAGAQSNTLKQSTAGAFAYGQAEQLKEVCDLGVMPLANDFAEPNEERAGYAPLKVMLCPRCSLAQLSVVVNPAVLYSRYAYVTSPSQTMKNHFANLRYDLGEESGGAIGTILEIASNDGLLMDFFREHGSRCVGIDPAENLCDLARARGFQVLTEPFDGQAEWVHHLIGKPDVILARHVFAHVHDWRRFIEGLDKVSGKDTLIALEVPYVEDQLESLSFDQIYHEHLSYVSVKAVHHLLEHTGLRLHRIMHYTIHGGSIVLMLRRRDSPKPPHPSVKNYLDQEKLGAEEWKKFDTKCRSLVRQLTAYVESLSSTGKTVVGYGASAKSAQWLNACGFTRKQVKFICDCTPQKQYRNTPGSEIPIVDEGALTRELPDYAICFAWNFAKEIIDKEQIFRQKGGKWIVPLPDFTIV